MLDFLYTIIIYPIVIILEFSFVFAQKLLNETGLSVIFISLIVSVLCLPLYIVAEKWQQIERDTVKGFKHKIDKIKKAFKGDEQYMILKTYYNQNHYHPIYALRSSFGLLIQIPFFIAAYSFLSHLEILKGVQFLFINNLGSPDKLITINGISFNLLPFVMTFVNCFSGFIYTKGLPAKDKIQIYGMSLLFLVLLYNSPSALVLYWTMNNVFSVFKNIYYKIIYKQKHLILLGLFSLLCIILTIICLKRFFFNTKSILLSIVLIFASSVPWFIILLKKYLIKIINVKYNAGISLSVFLLSVFTIWSLTGFFIPSQLISSSPQEFSFIDDYSSPFYFFFNTLFQSFGLFILWPVCLYFLFSENFKKYFSFIIFALCACMLINVFIFSGNYGLISIHFIYDRSPTHKDIEYLFNIFILFLTAVICFIIYKYNINRFIPIIISLCVFSLLGSSIVNLIKINSEYNQLKTYYVKPDIRIKEITPVFRLSKNEKNIVLLMLDRAISVFIPYIFQESPELTEKYSGFTYFPNTVSFNGYTLISSPALFGGYEYTPLEMNNSENTLIEKHNEAILMLPRILSENNFDVTITDPPHVNHKWISDLSIFEDYPEINALITDGYYTDFWLKENKLNIQDTSFIIKRNMLWYSVVKTMPQVFRNPIYMHGNWCSPVSGYSIRLTLDGYSVLDYLPLLTEITEENANCALIMTNNTTHKNLFMQAPDYTPSINITNYGTSRFSKEHAYHTTAAAIKRISEWFDYLKRENIYDNTKIILVSDHGPEPNFVTKLGLPFNVDQFNPLLMVKDFNSTGEFKSDMTFMSNADVPYLSLNNLIDNPVNPFTGKKISTEAKNEPLYITMWRSTHNTKENEYKFGLNPKYDYYVQDNIFKKENWKKANE